MITIRQIYLAYRKLKGQVYYDNSNLRMKFNLAEWENNLTKDNFECDPQTFEILFEKHVKDLLSFLNNGSVDCPYFEKMKIDYYSEIKEFEHLPPPPKGYITNDSNNNNNLKIAKCNYIANMPIELHLIGVLWIMYMNNYILNDISKCNYANRIRKDTIANDKYKSQGPRAIQLSVNYRYFDGYKQWRDKALDAASKLMNDGKNATIISLDIKRFYYSARVNLKLVLEQASKWGYLNPAYREDKTLSFLTEIVSAINMRYTKLVENLIKEEGLATIEENETLLPVGMISSGLIANLYLCAFDQKVKNLNNCIYYGRYVDDMLFVFSGKQDKRRNDPVASFIRNYFVKKDILDDDDNDYCLTDYKNLKIQTEKIVMESFSSYGPKSALNLFKKKLRERSSESRFLLDEDAAEEEFENAAYDLEFSDSVNKIRSIEAFREDKFGASRYLARKISLAGFVGLHPNDKGKNIAEKNDYRRNAKQILNFFKGRNCFMFSLLWEKVSSYYTIKGDYKSLLTFAHKTMETINKLKLHENANKHLDIETIKNNYKEQLRLSLFMSVALNPKLIDQLGILYDGFWDRKIIMQLRNANMMLHTRVGSSCVNYTSLLRGEFNLYTGFSKIEDLTEWKPNIQFWLSPRFVYLGEIFSICFRIAINKNYDAGLSKLQNEALHYYNSLNFEWTSFFGGVHHMMNAPFVYTPKEENSVLVAESQIIDFKSKDVQKSFSNNECNKNIGIVNIQVKKEDFVNSLRGKPNLSKERKEDLYHIINEATKRDTKADMLVLPELALPVDWLDLMVEQCRTKQMAIVSGLEYIVVHDNVALNIVVTILPFRIGKYYNDCVLIPRIKNYYAPAEKKLLINEHFSIPAMRRTYDLIHWRQTYFSVYNCFELSSIKDRTLMLGKVDFIVATELNADTNFYSDIIGSWTRDIHCFVIQVNTSEYGDSRIMQPSDTIHKNRLFVKGGRNSVVMIDRIDICELRKMQLEYIKNYNNAKPVEIKPSPPLYIKQTPPNIKKEDVITRLKDCSFADQFTQLLILFK